MRARKGPQAGFSLIELVLTIGVILIVSTWAMPSFLNYYRSARVRSGAQTVSAYLNQARQLAIKTNGAVCVTSTTSTMQLRSTNCSGSLINVAGITSTGSNINLPERVALSTTSNALFGQLGNGNGAVYTVTDTASSRALTVTVAPSGRITIP